MRQIGPQARKTPEPPEPSSICHDSPGPLLHRSMTVASSGIQRFLAGFRRCYGSAHFGCARNQSLVAARLQTNFAT